MASPRVKPMKRTGRARRSPTKVDGHLRENAERRTPNAERRNARRRRALRASPTRSPVDQGRRLRQSERWLLSASGPAYRTGACQRLWMPLTSSRVKPRSSPSLVLVCLLVLVASCAKRPPTVAASAPPVVRTRTISARQSTTTVLPGLDVFLSNLPRALRGKRVGLITNHSAIDRAGRLGDRQDRIAQAAHARGAARARARHPRHRRRGREGRRRGGCEDGRARLLALHGRGPRPDTRDAEERRRPRVRPAGSRRAHVDVRVHDGAVDEGGRPSGHPVRGARSAQPDRRRDRGGRADRSRLHVVRRHVPDPGATRPDRRRTRGVLQPCVRHRCRPHRRPRVVVAARPVDGRHGPAVGQPLAEPAIAGGPVELSRHRVLRGHEPHRGARHRPSIRTDRRAVARRPGGGRDDERALPAGRPLRAGRDARCYRPRRSSRARASPDCASWSPTGRPIGPCVRP